MLHENHCCRLSLSRGTQAILRRRTSVLVPIYIVIGEAIVGMPLVWIGARLEQVTAVGAALLGCAVGLLIFGAYVFAYALAG